MILKQKEYLRTDYFFSLGISTSPGADENRRHRLVGAPAAQEHDRPQRLLRPLASRLAADRRTAGAPQTGATGRRRVGGGGEPPHLLGRGRRGGGGRGCGILDRPRGLLLRRLRRAHAHLRRDPARVPQTHASNQRDRPHGARKSRRNKDQQKKRRDLEASSLTQTRFASIEQSNWGTTQKRQPYIEWLSRERKREGERERGGKPLAGPADSPSSIAKDLDFATR